MFSYRHVFFLRDDVRLLCFLTDGLIYLSFASSLLLLGPCASQSLPRSAHSSFGCGWRVAQMFADKIGLHKWDTFQLMVVDGFDESMLGWTKECLMHELDLILEVGQCMDIVCRMINRLIGQQLQVFLDDDIGCGFWWSWIDWEPPKIIDGISAARQY